MNDAIESARKPLNAMNRLGDMGHFPPLVHAGATLNVLLTVTVTWFVEPHFPQPWVPVFWIALVLAANLLPVVLLRLTLTPATPYPALAEMDFFRDQHKFSDWVYLAASADMAFWVLLAWTVATLHRTNESLAGLLTIAGVATFSPVLVRQRRK